MGELLVELGELLLVRGGVEVTQGGVGLAVEALAREAALLGVAGDVAVSAEEDGTRHWRVVRGAVRYTWVSLG